jgi:hypothetical protein
VHRITLNNTLKAPSLKNLKDYRVEDISKSFCEKSSLGSLCFASLCVGTDGLVLGQETYCISTVSWQVPVGKDHTTMRCFIFSCYDKIHEDRKRGYLAHRFGG